MWRMFCSAEIKQICHELNYKWRECTLDPVTTVHAFLRQVLAGNTACDHVPHLTGLPVTGEAYCKARSRLPVELFQRLMRAVVDAVIQSGGGSALARPPSVAPRRFGLFDAGHGRAAEGLWPIGCKSRAADFPWPIS